MKLRGQNRKDYTFVTLTFQQQLQTIYVKKCKVNAKRFQQLSLLANYTQIPQKTNKRVTLQWLWRPLQVNRMVKTHSCPCNLKSSRNAQYNKYTPLLRSLLIPEKYWCAVWMLGNFSRKVCMDNSEVVCRTSFGVSKEKQLLIQLLLPYEQKKRPRYSPISETVLHIGSV